MRRDSGERAKRAGAKHNRRLKDNQTVDAVCRENRRGEPGSALDEKGTDSASFEFLQCVEDIICRQSLDSSIREPGGQLCPACRHNDRWYFARSSRERAQSAESRVSVAHDASWLRNRRLI